LLKALTREPDDRYQTAQQFGDALTGYLFARQLKVTNYDIANLVNTAISEDVVPVKAEISLIDRLIQEELDGSVALRTEHVELPPASPSPLSAAPDGVLEDPASWFASGAVPRPSSRTGWHEPGVEYSSDLLEEDPLEEPITTEHHSSLRPNPASSIRALALGPVSVPVAAALQKPAAKGGNGKYVVMGMALLAVLAIAIALLGKSL
jgi:hypothetical protein